jgi:dTDP-4-amino-4,6-dideoxygalactose transaminase
MEDAWIALSDPDMGLAEIEAVSEVLRSPRLSAGPRVEDFEAEFADYLERRYAVAVASGTLGMVLSLRALGIGPGDEVIAAAYSWHHAAHAIFLVGATPVLADSDYWSGCLAPDKAAAKIGPRTRAIIAGNCNGHPAAWKEFRVLASAHGVKLIEDSTEAIGSRYEGRLVGNFGDLAVFDFSQPGALVCGEGGMVVTDDPDLASELRYYRSRGLDERFAIAIASRVPHQAAMSDVTAAIGLTQLERLDEILARRKQVETYYLRHIQAFEGIKPPYLAPEIDEIHWLVFQVQLGTRFTKSARNQIVEDLTTERIEAVAFCDPLHLQYFYSTLGYKKRDLLVAEKIADRSLALPFHSHLSEDEVEFIVKTAKDSSVNVGAGAAIYL